MKPNPGVRVIDGDTLAIGLGPRTERVRLRGINAPEKDECLGDAATAAAVAAVSEGPIRLERFGTDRYGRTLAYVWTGDDALLQERLVASGLAWVNDYGDPGPAAERLRAAERDAESRGRGLFDRDACGTPSALQIRVAAMDANPPGDDLEPGAGESVTLRGPAGSPLGGWIVQDLTASHRIVFPNDVRLDRKGALRVYSSCGQAAPGAYFACARASAIWNNSGDVAVLKEPNGNVASILRWPAQGAP